MPEEPASVRPSLERLIHGDPAAAAWLYDDFAPGLFRRLRRRYQRDGGPDAEDLLQDAFIFFFQNDCKVLRDFLEKTPATELTAARLERRLWDLACGLASNRRRSAWSRKVVSIDEFREPDPDAGSERRSLARDHLRRLDACLRDGRERVYLYFQLRFRDGLSPDEVTRATGWSKKATYKLKDALNQALGVCTERLGLVPA